MTLRPYQTRMVDDTRTAFSQGARVVLHVLATGLGKTNVALHIAQEAVAKGKRVLFLAHTKELINQPAKRLSKNGFEDYGIIQADHWRKRPRCPIQIASVPTLARRLDTMSTDYDLFIADEAHRIRGASWEAILAKLHEKNCRMRGIAMTATPYRLDGKGLGCVADALVAGPDTAEGIEQGFLVPPVYWRGLAPAKSDLKLVSGDYDGGAKANVKELRGDIVTRWKQKSAGRKTVAFCYNVEHSKALAWEYREAGIEAIHLDANTPDGERDRIMENPPMVVCNVGVLTEGVDIPSVSCIVWARLTKSRGLWRQMSGRGLRLHPGKKDCIFHDHCGMLEEPTLGFLTDPDIYDLESGVRRRLSVNLFTCPHCEGELKNWPRNCSLCGKFLWDAPVPAPMVVMGGDAGFEEVKAPPPPSFHDKRMAYHALLGEARCAGKPVSVADRAFHKRFGHNPDKRHLEGVRDDWAWVTIEGPTNPAGFAKGIRVWKRDQRTSVEKMDMVDLALTLEGAEL